MANKNPNQNKNKRNKNKNRLIIPQGIIASSPYISLSLIVGKSKYDTKASVTHQILFLSQKENLVVTHTEASYRTQAMTNYPLIPLGSLSLARQNDRHSQFSEIKPHLVSSPAETKLCRQPMPDSHSMEKLKSKQRLEQAMEWLNAESN